MTSPSIPGYEFERQIGRGGMGRVWKARDTRLDRIVAVKTLLDDDDPELVSRFETEARAVAALSHPNIARLFDFGRTGSGTFFCVLEYIGGGTLAERSAGRPQDPKLSARTIEVVARAMAHAHELGILHRDLKPANILIDDSPAEATHKPAAGPDSSGVVRVMAQGGWPPESLRIADFGLARRIKGDSRVTRTGQIVGTPAYMAPEQASGMVQHPGPGVDVYSLGAILYELLTGRPPFNGSDSMETLMLTLTQEPPAPRTLRPSIPQDLQTICLKCLEKKPSRRYATASELAEDLERYRLGHPIAARPASRTERMRKWVVRNPWKSAAAVLCSLSGIGAAVGLLLVQSAYNETARTNGQLAASIREADAAFLLSREALDRIVVRVRDDLYEVPQATEVMLATSRDSVELYQKLHELRPADVDVARSYMRSLESLGLAEWIFGSRETSAAIYEQLGTFVDTLAATHPGDVEFAVMQAKLLLDRIDSAPDHESPTVSEMQQRLDEQLKLLLVQHPESADVHKLASLAAASRMTAARRADDWPSYVAAAEDRVSHARSFVQFAAMDAQEEAGLWVVRSLFMLARGQTSSGQPQLAESTFEEAREVLTLPILSPRSRDVRSACADADLGLAQLHLQRELLPQAALEFESAQTQLLQIIAEFPDDWNALDSLIKVLVGRAQIAIAGQDAEAADTFRRLATQHLHTIVDQNPDYRSLPRLREMLEQLNSSLHVSPASQGNEP